MSRVRVKPDCSPLSSLQGRCCEKRNGRLSSRHLALRSVCEHMGPLVPPPGGLPPNPHWCDLTGARASPPRGPVTTQAPEQIARRLRTPLYGRWFLALFPERVRTSKSHTQTAALTLGFLISNLPRSWVLGRSRERQTRGEVSEVGVEVGFDAGERNCVMKKCVHVHRTAGNTESCCATILHRGTISWLHRACSYGHVQRCFVPSSTWLNIPLGVSQQQGIVLSDIGDLADFIQSFCAWLCSQYRLPDEEILPHRGVSPEQGFFLNGTCNPII